MRSEKVADKAARAQHLMTLHPFRPRNMAGSQEQAPAHQQEDASIDHTAGQPSPVGKTVTSPPGQQNHQHPGHPSQHPVNDAGSIQPHHVQKIGRPLHHLAGFVEIIPAYFPDVKGHHGSQQSRSCQYGNGAPRHSHPNGGMVLFMLKYMTLLRIQCHTWHLY